jgi:hypothetical protein
MTYGVRWSSRPWSKAEGPYRDRKTNWVPLPGLDTAFGLLDRQTFSQLCNTDLLKISVPL